MMLTIDAGNSSLGVGVFQKEKGKNELINSFRICIDKNASADELGASCKSILENTNANVANIGAAIYSSVVPELNRSIDTMLYTYFNVNALQVTHEHFARMPIRYDNPAAVGTDRLVTAYYTAQTFGAPAIVIDFGTATTFSAVSRNNEFLGGVILPGIRISLDALVRRASKLTEVELGYPKRAIETETARGMQAGVYFQTIDAVNGIVGRMRKEMNENGDLCVVATGGLAGYSAKETDAITHVDDALCLRGLKFLFDELSPSS